ncbi:hypothetical protein [Streptomyces sp. NPDC052496]|uniref:hypothetical protein n=1 Tax=Streptomyces sp. NPDC052496 TaxID=3154951 RepID=UPI00341CD159
MSYSDSDHALDALLQAADDAVLSRLDDAVVFDGGRAILSALDPDAPPDTEGLVLDFWPHSSRTSGHADVESAALAAATLLLLAKTAKWTVRSEPTPQVTRVLEKLTELKFGLVNLTRRVSPMFIDATVQGAVARARDFTEALQWACADRASDRTTALMVLSAVRNELLFAEDAVQRRAKDRDVRRPSHFTAEAANLHELLTRAEPLVAKLFADDDDRHHVSTPLR